eukprot:CAMPEP_0196580520 /NCGR_PEP_ID=MMETSP1081-20130531/28981_1 /TAXON_ID=36882 /ORGANISM="Pyramimonas amylifera, Strain CCMP720" /LENGTH=85 /DNA_ID=CAMNT_0041900401 /DNA_START=244 /DNA_END=501 /DNA_ORIENTATION=+
MWSVPAQFPVVAPRSLETLVSLEDEDAHLSQEEAALEAQWTAIRQNQSQLSYPGKNSSLANQIDPEPLDDQHDEIDEESDVDEFE